MRDIRDVRISREDKKIYSDLFSQNKKKKPELSVSNTFTSMFEDKREIPLKSFDIWLGNGVSVELRISDDTNSSGNYLLDIFIFGRDEMRIPLEPLDGFTGIYDFDIEGKPYGLNICVPGDGCSHE